MAAASSPVGKLFHFICSSFFCVLLHYDLKIITPGVEMFGGRWKYLTFLNAIFQVSFFILASLGDIIAFFKGQDSNWITTIRDTAFASIVFPCGIFVSTTFWGIYFMDRELVYPKILDDIIPAWINHGLHTWVAVAVILEAAIIHHRYPRNIVGLFLTLLFQGTYLSWISYIAYTQDFWVYPFLRMMENSARGMFFALCALLLIFFYFMGKWMNRVIWEGGESKAQEKEIERKRKVKKVK